MGEKVWPTYPYMLSLAQMGHELDSILGPPQVLKEETPCPWNAGPLKRATEAIG